MQMVVAGVDGSEGGERAAVAAAEIAKVGARLLPVTVVRAGWWESVEHRHARGPVDSLIEGQKQIDETVAMLELDGVDCRRWRSWVIR
jgi:hypothetical protein